MIVTDETFGCALTAVALIDAGPSSRRKTGNGEIQTFDHVRILLAAFLQK